MASANKESTGILTSVIGRLSLATGLSDTTKVVAHAARDLVGADGTTFVLRDRDKCYYADEDAISTLWKGMRFPMSVCISGWSMLNREVVTIRDIYLDSRIPHAAYKPTFVKSLCMVPIRAEDPIGAIGAYWSKEHTPTADEIKVLQILANSTAVALENLELRNSVRLYSVETSDLRGRANDLEMAMYSMAHDLRSPISVMTGLGEILRSQLPNVVSPDLVEHVRCIVETGRRTADQIDRLLSLYRASNGKLALQDVNVSEFADRILSGFRPSLEGRALKTQIESPLMVYGDPALIYIVLENLISNALKYSSRRLESRITIGGIGDAAFTTIFVKDNGIGFGDHQRDRLFQPLGRLEGTDTIPGTGLGLASVAKIVEMHGGRVRAEGREQEGATFYFSLPRRAV